YRRCFQVCGCILRPDDRAEFACPWRRAGWIDAKRFVSQRIELPGVLKVLVAADDRVRSVPELSLIVKYAAIGAVRIVLQQLPLHFGGRRSLRDDRISSKQVIEIDCVRDLEFVDLHPLCRAELYGRRRRWSWNDKIDHWCSTGLSRRKDIDDGLRDRHG